MDRPSTPALDREALRALSRRSDLPGGVQAGAHIGLLIGTGLCVLEAQGTGWLPLAMLVHGIVLVFLFAPLHETIHRTAFRTRRLNDVVAHLCALPLLLPPTWFRAFHFAHHRHTQDPERDPELAVPKPETRRAWLIHISGVPYWVDRIRSLAGHARGRVDDPFVAPNDRPAVVREARTFLGIYGGLGLISIALGSAHLLLLWLGPALLGQPFLRLYLLAEHTGCPLVPEMLRNTRTTLTGWLVRRLAWNMPFHAEHHAYPAVPFHALPAVHVAVREHLEVVGEGYLRVTRELMPRT